MRRRSLLQASDVVDENTLLKAHFVSSTKGTFQVCNSTYGIKAIYIDGERQTILTSRYSVSKKDFWVWYELSEPSIIPSRMLYKVDYVRDIIIPDNIYQIGQNFTTLCTSLSGLTLGNNVTIIGGSAFSYTHLRGSSSSTLHIPSSVTSMGINAFYYNEISTFTSDSSVFPVVGNCLMYNSVKKVLYRR